MADYSAPIDLSVTIQAELQAASVSGGLASLGTGPAAPLNAVTFTQVDGNMTAPVPPKSLFYNGVLVETSGNSSTSNLDLQVFSKDVFNPVALTGLATPNGVILPLALQGQGNIIGTYDNGVLGVGSTFTVDPASLPLNYDDMNAVTDGDRVLLGGQTDTTQNGIYDYTLATGTLTRSVDFNNPLYMTNGSYVFCNHSANENASNVFMNAPSVTLVGTSPVTFTGNIFPLANVIVIANAVETDYNNEVYYNSTTPQILTLTSSNSTPQTVPSFDNAVFNTSIYYQPF